MEEFRVGEVTVKGYLALPAGGAGPAVIVLHAWWGLNDFFKDLCERLAAEGFVAFAPDLYHGAVASTIHQAEQLGDKLKRDVANQEMVAAVQYLGKHPAVSQPALGVIGFSLGAFLALWLAQNQPKAIAAAVLFYGTGDGEYTKARAAFLGHFAENDEYEPPEAVKKLEDDLRTAGRDPIFHTYPGTGHWFFESDRPDAYNPDAAQLAWERTITFLRSKLG